MNENSEHKNEVKIIEPTRGELYSTPLDVLKDIITNPPMDPPPPTAEPKKADWLDCPNGMRLMRFPAPGKTTYIGKYTVRDPKADANPVRVCRIDVDRDLRCARVTVNDKDVCTLTSHLRLKYLERAAVAALKRYLSYRDAENVHARERRKRRKEAKRVALLAEAQARIMQSARDRAANALKAEEARHD